MTNIVEAGRYAKGRTGPMGCNPATEKLSGRFHPGFAAGSLGPNCSLLLFEQNRSAFVFRILNRALISCPAVTGAREGVEAKRLGNTPYHQRDCPA